ncbi:LacI family DNA-binding transcriptional regulator [Paludibacterium yongneupense]|uniref:LacI family DNA-binding transcriptional regulator n=1 Tax=Paludibacterium yongneupense TaxID=400061 RepID=UPI0003F8C243|nr:LacI family DNA-binding transcriptional regulator [Paludibacterium yongneupense]
MATITDVCRVAGVSKATVSRVLNNTGQVKESTREIVIQAIQALDYRPNTLAQALANQRSDTIGLIISDFAGGYFGRLLRQATRSADEAGMQLIVTDGHEDAERERKAIDMLVHRRCDAIVLYSRCMGDAQLTQLTRELPVPLIVLNRYLPEAAERSVVFEQSGAARMATEHLIALGHQRIACITPKLASRTGQLRLQGYKDALNAHGIALDEDLISAGAFSPSTGYEACSKLLQTGKSFTALLCCSDMMAEGAYRALAERGLKIPEDVSVFGFDNDPATAYMIPALSTVKLPISEMTRQAIQQAVKLSNGLPVSPIPPFIGQLILRESVASASGQVSQEKLAPPTEIEDD